MVKKARKIAYTTLLAMIMSVMPFSKAHRLAEPYGDRLNRRPRDINFNPGQQRGA